MKCDLGCSYATRELSGHSDVRAHDGYLHVAAGGGNSLAARPRVQPTTNKHEHPTLLHQGEVPTFHFLHRFEIHRRALAATMHLLRHAADYDRAQPF